MNSPRNEQLEPLLLRGDALAAAARGRYQVAGTARCEWRGRGR